MEYAPSPFLVGFDSQCEYSLEGEYQQRDRQVPVGRIFLDGRHSPYCCERKRKRNKNHDGEFDLEMIRDINTNL